MSGPEEADQRAGGRQSDLTLLAGLCLAISCALILFGLNRGWDITDESYYLVWIRDPEVSSFVYQPFGYLLHPLYLAVGSDLALFVWPG